MSVMFLSIILSLALFPEGKGLVIFSTYFLLSMWFSGPSMVGVVDLSDLSYSLVSLSLLLVGLTLLTVCGRSLLKEGLVMISLFVVVGFFLTSNLVLFFVFFELSLLPMFALIIFSGSNPERVKSSVYMMMFTFVSSSPLMASIFMIVVSCGVSKMEPCGLSEWVTTFMALAFLVKIPMFLFHSWLPKAHVEAPLEGSILLAGVMLKVGCYGLIRVLWMTGGIKEGLEDVVYCVALWGAVGSLLAALSSDDLKMSVAFSSVSHMNCCLVGVMTASIMGSKGCLVVMLAHGVVSPMLFWTVTLVYQLVGSRSSVVSKGSAAKFFLFQFVSLVSWMCNISPPPLMSFVGELSVLGSAYSYWCWSLGVMGVYVVLGSFYSMVNFGLSSHSGKKLTSKGVISSIPISLFMVSVLSFLIYGFVFVESMVGE